MSPILDLQRRYMEVGRIRLGEKAPSGAPKRLDAWRLTSSNRQALEEAAALWGGDVREWKDAPTPGQFELYTNSDTLPIMVLPGPDPVSQYYEQWNRGGATHRCDGVRNIIDDKPCSCSPEARTCKPTTRVSVALPDLPGFGVWRFESHGWHSANELPVTLELIRAAAEKGTMLPGALRIEQRQNISGGTTKRFPVAVIDLELTMRQLASGNGGTRQIAASNVTPIERPDAPSTARQLEAVNDEHERPSRSNAAATLPPTGARPRPETHEQSADDEIEDAVVSLAQVQRLWVIVRANRIEEEMVKAVVLAITGKESTKEIPRDKYDAVIAALSASQEAK